LDESIISNSTNQIKETMDKLVHLIENDEEVKREKMEKANHHAKMKR